MPPLRAGRTCGITAAALYALAPAGSNSVARECGCLAHRLGNAADQPDGRPNYPSDMTDAEWGRGPRCVAGAGPVGGPGRAAGGLVPLADGGRGALPGRGRHRLAGDACGLPRMGPRPRVLPALAGQGSVRRVPRPAARPGPQDCRRRPGADGGDRRRAGSVRRRLRGSASGSRRRRTGRCCSGWCPRCTGPGGGGGARDGRRRGQRGFRCWRAERRSGRGKLGGRDEFTGSAGGEGVQAYGAVAVAGVVGDQGVVVEQARDGEGLFVPSPPQPTGNRKIFGTLRERASHSLANGPQDFLFPREGRRIIRGKAAGRRSGHRHRHRVYAGPGPRGPGRGTTSVRARPREEPPGP
ncbi:hypothetical protein SAMN05216371_0186 [Streptomyces sp. TLI_053]|nr:hypothetical protein SAMN05216371_0186 [Streptomyces sp. TLI_053]